MNENKLKIEHAFLKFNSNLIIFQPFFEQKCSENTQSLDCYIEMIENKEKISEYFNYRFGSIMQKFQSLNYLNNKKDTSVLIRILILSYRVGEESFTAFMDSDEKILIQEKINNAQFNLTGWNDNAFKYIIKRLLNLGKFLIFLKNI